MNYSTSYEHIRLWSSGMTRASHYESHRKELLVRVRYEIHESPGSRTSQSFSKPSPIQSVTLKKNSKIESEMGA